MLKNEFNKTIFTTETRILYKEYQCCVFSIDYELKSIKIIYKNKIITLKYREIVLS